MTKLSSDEKRKAAGLASKIATFLSSDVAQLAKQNIDPAKINLIVTNALDILQGMGLASAAVAEALSKAGCDTRTEASVNRIQQLQQYLRAHPGRKKAVIATLICAGKPKLATAVSRMVVAKKAHFSLSDSAKEYANDVMLAANNMSPWAKNTAEAEAKVKKSIRIISERDRKRVLEAFSANDVKYLVETDYFGDEDDPYNLDPPDPKIGKALEKELAKILGKDWKKVAGVKSAKSQSSNVAEGDSKAWIVFIEGHGVHNVDTLWEPLLKVVKKAGYQDASAEPYDDATIVVHPDSDY